MRELAPPQSLSTNSLKAAIQSDILNVTHQTEYQKKNKSIDIYINLGSTFLCNLVHIKNGHNNNNNLNSNKNTDAGGLISM